MWQSESKAQKERLIRFCHFFHCGDGEIRVSSRHHMAVDEVAPGFIVTARCPDGVIEAIESDDPSWVAIGTQFHPENNASSALDARIFDEFIDAIREPQSATLKMVA